MESIVVTITDMDRNFNYDLEIPCSAVFSNVCDKIREIISMIDPNSDIMSFTRVIIERNRREVVFTKTVEESCIWNGDYLIFI